MPKTPVSPESGVSEGLAESRRILSQEDSSDGDNPIDNGVVGMKGEAEKLTGINKPDRSYRRVAIE